MTAYRKGERVYRSDRVNRGPWKRGDCPTGKLCFDTRNGVRSYGSRAAKGAGKPFYFYKCMTCRAYHITSKPAFFSIPNERIG